MSESNLKRDDADQLSQEELCSVQGGGFVPAGARHPRFLGITADEMQLRRAVQHEQLPSGAELPGALRSEHGRTAPVAIGRRVDRCHEQPLSSAWNSRAPASEIGTALTGGGK